MAEPEPIRRHLADIATHFSTLASCLDFQLPPGSPDSQQKAFTRILTDALQALPAIDSHYHRRRLVRELSTRVRAAVADLLEIAAIEGWDEQLLVERCIAAPEYCRLVGELQSDLEALSGSDGGGGGGGGGDDGASTAIDDEWLAELSAAVRSDPPPSSDEDDGASLDGRGERECELDRLLHDELNADLPPFWELPAAIAAVQDGDRTPAGVQPAWTKLRAFSASDLLESDQWPEIPAALRALLVGPHLSGDERSEVAAMHTTSNREGGPRVLGSRHLIIHPLPNVAGSAADRLTFLLLTGVVGNGPRAHSISISGRAGRDDHRFFKKKGGLRIEKVAFRFIGAGFWSFTPCRMWLAAPRIDQLSFCSTA